MSKNSADFHLPDEILSVIPTDPFDQLDLARKITSMAVASRVSQLEAETTNLQQKIVVKDQMIAKLQDRVYELDRLFQESDSRLRLMIEENLQLAKERDTLALNGKKLTRDLLKLETFKRQLMQSLNDDTPAQTEGDIETSDASVTGSSSWKATKAMSNRLTITPHIGPQPSLNTTIRVSSTGCSPRRFYNADSSAKVTSGAASPTNSRFEDQGFMPSWYSSSQQTSASNSPPHRHPSQGRIPQIDGKEFFRQARTRLSYEQFGSFLANIKELNAHRKSRQETLAKAEEIFGMENKDLYLSFQRLLNRNVQ